MKNIQGATITKTAIFVLTSETSLRTAASGKTDILLSTHLNALYGTPKIYYRVDEFSVGTV